MINRRLLNIFIIVISILSFSTIFVVGTSYSFIFGETAEDYFPPEGTTKIFEYTTGKKPTVYATVGKATSFQGKKTIPIFNKAVIVGEKSKEHTSYYEVSESFIKHVGSTYTEENKNIVYDPPYTEWRFPMKEGISWEENFVRRTTVQRNEKIQRIKSKFTVLGKEKIWVPAGSFNCWKIEYIVEENGITKGKGIEWISKGLGTIKNVVKFPDEKESEKVLKSYSRK
ncbi:MAG: DUF3108 domain-containing protein [Nitrospira sp.]|nr:DUF3108 domain-containing protein [Nitrospira sp.]